jgi:hypothetical protein
MITAKQRLLSLVIFIVTATACGNPHFFPRLQPLFPGLDESSIRANGRRALDEAKADFVLLKRGEAPRYATFVKTAPYSRSRVYDGKGYRLTFVCEQSVYPHRVGPEIVIFSGITGGREYRYREIDETF